MYRALALAAIRAGVNPEDPAEANGCATSVSIRQEGSPDGGTRTFLDDEDVSTNLRTPPVSDAASKIATHPAVQQFRAFDGILAP